MEWLERMNRAIDYIEANLTGEIELREAARMACCSSYQFQRMFSFITDVTLAEYIRRRRLTLAALELQHGGLTKVIDVALKYGYESPVSFARAFHALHGITPAMARQEGIALKAYPRLSFLITIKGAEAMNYRIETKESFEVFGIEGVFRVDGGGEAPQTPAKLWEQSFANGVVKRLEACAGELRHSSAGICIPFMRYAATGRPGQTRSRTCCAPSKVKAATWKYNTVTIPSYTWAIFPSEPHPWDQFGETIETLYKRFYTEWLPTAGYEQADGIEFEMTGDKDGLNYIELWFAVRKV